MSSAYPQLGRAVSFEELADLCSHSNNMNASKVLKVPTTPSHGWLFEAIAPHVVVALNELNPPRHQHFSTFFIDDLAPCDAVCADTHEKAPLAFEINTRRAQEHFWENLRQAFETRHVIAPDLSQWTLRHIDFVCAADAAIVRKNLKLQRVCRRSVCVSVSALTYDQLTNLLMHHMCLGLAGPDYIHYTQPRSSTDNDHDFNGLPRERKNLASNAKISLNAPASTNSNYHPSMEKCNHKAVSDIDGSIFKALVDTCITLHDVHSQVSWGVLFDSYGAPRIPTLSTLNVVSKSYVCLLAFLPSLLEVSRSTFGISAHVLQPDRC